MVRTCVSSGQGNLSQVFLWLNGGKWAGNAGLYRTGFVLRRFGGSEGRGALKQGCLNTTVKSIMGWKTKCIR